MMLLANLFIWTYAGEINHPFPILSSGRLRHLIGVEHLLILVINLLRRKRTRKAHPWTRYSFLRVTMLWNVRVWILLLKSDILATFPLSLAYPIYRGILLGPVVWIPHESLVNFEANLTQTRVAIPFPTEWPGLLLVGVIIIWILLVDLLLRLRISVEYWPECACWFLLLHLHPLHAWAHLGRNIGDILFR